MDQDFYRKLFLVATVLILGAVLLQILEPFKASMTWAACLALLLYPTHRWLTLKFRGRSTASAGLLTALVPLVLLGPLTTLGVVFSNQIGQLVDHLQKNPFSFDSQWLAQLEAYPAIGPAARWLHVNTDVSTEQLQAWLAANAQVALKTLAAGGGNLVLGALGTLVSFFLMLFLFFFMLRDGHLMIARLIRLVPIGSESRTQLLELISSTTRAVVYGTGLTALAQGALVGVSFAIADLPSPVVFSVIAAVFALLPAGGTAFVWVPAMIWLGAQGQWGWALFMAVWGVGVSLADNVLRPLLISRHAPVSTLAVFMGVVGGVAAFGPVGVIAGPVLLTLIMALIRFAEDQVLVER